MSGTLQVTLLGCGSSGGVPRVGGDWGACDPAEPRNRRTRCSILVEYWEGQGQAKREDRTIVLIDTSPDLRDQLLKANISRLDALFYTHEHADQTHGIDDLRAIAYRMRKKIPTYMNDHTRDILLDRFSYCFETPEGRVHPPILDAQQISNHGQVISVDGPGGPLKVRALNLSHGATPVLGFFLNDKVVYTPDVYDIDDETINILRSPDVWIIDALRYGASPSHAHLDKAMSWLARTQTRQAILTNMHVDLDYATLKNEVPANQVVGYDGLTVNLRDI